MRVGWIALQFLGVEAREFFFGLAQFFGDLWIGNRHGLTSRGIVAQSPRRVNRAPRDALDQARRLQ